jgi:hypothetical protein
MQPLRSPFTEQSFYPTDDFLVYCVTKMWLCYEERIVFSM